MKKLVAAIVVTLFLLSVLGVAFPFGPNATSYPAVAGSTTSIRFAVIGDYGLAGTNELDVANLVIGWSPDFVITVGDNNCPSGAASTIDQNIGQYYHNFICPYTGGYGAGADTNRFFPTIGNHDWGTPGAAPYLAYFTLPGNERYYDFVWGPVHFFALDSDFNEPDGTSSTSTQANWLHTGLAASTEPWKLVYFHHAPYSSGGYHGSSTWMQWPFQQWGATAVLSGHDHDYERLLVNGLPYFVDGLGGQSIRAFGTPLPESQVRYNGDYGAMLVQADTGSIEFKFYSHLGSLIDDYKIVGPAEAPSNLSATATSSSQMNLAWTDNSVNEDGFKIERAASSTGPWSQIATVGANVVSYSDTGLNPSTTYYYRVCAYNGAGDSGYSNTVSATTQATSIMHVASIDMSWSKKGRLYTAYAIVRIVDQNGAPVQGATVYGTWSGAWKGSVGGVTDANGKVKLNSGKVKDGGTFTFKVTNVVKTAWTYDLAQNVITSKTITCQ